MENAEKQIAVINNLFRSPETYNFYLTDKRLIAINTKSQYCFVSLGN